MWFGKPKKTRFSTLSLIRAKPKKPNFFPKVVRLRVPKQLRSAKARISGPKIRISTKRERKKKKKMLLTSFLINNQ